MQTESPSLFPMLMIAAGGLLVVFVVGWFLVHNRFMRLKNYIVESWSNIDVALKRRYDLIPNLVETVKGYADHEQETLSMVTEARDRALSNIGPILEQAKDENELVHSVNRLLALAEAYPDLKASQGYLALQDELTNTEDRIAAARRFYNANVRDFNTMLESFPSSVVGGSLHLSRADYFEVDSLEFRDVSRVSLR